MSIQVPTTIISGTVGNQLLVKSKNKEHPFVPECAEIEEKNQFWTIQPNLPSGLEIDSGTGQISGISEEKVSSSYSLHVSGSGKEFVQEIYISILRVMPSDIVNLIKNLSTDGSSIGHGICEFIDNSIDADATKIDVHMNYEIFSNDPEKRLKPWLIVEDNGKGISKGGKISQAALEDALGWATSPDEEYDETRLGAYGVGLPAAALTSSLYCTVFTKKDGETAIGHMSYTDIDESGYLRFFDLEDIPGFLTEAKSFKYASDLLKKKKNGTIILLQDHYQLRASIQEPGSELNNQKFKEQMNLVKKRLKDYLSLVYHKFLGSEGINLRRADGSVLNRKITINLAGKLNPLDPLLEHSDSKIVGKLGTHIAEHNKSICTIRGKDQYYSIRMAILPGQKSESGYGRLNKDGSDFDESLANALLVFRSAECAPAKPPPQELQGLYLYRNHRLIEFATWKDLFKQAPQAQVARVAISTPLGLPIFDPKLAVHNDFSVDQRKRKMSMTGKVMTEIKSILGKKRHWHVDDTNQHPINTRAIKRAEYDKLGSKAKKTKTNPPGKAIISPDVVPEAFVPMKMEFKDLTPVSGSPTRQWTLDGKRVGTGKKYFMEIEDSGEHKLVLTIHSGKKSWQKSLKFNALSMDDTTIKPKKKNPKNEWGVVPIPKSPTDPPIELVGTAYEVNTNNAELAQVIHRIGLLLGLIPDE